MEKEALIRLKCLGVSEDVINTFKNGEIPITNSSGEVETELSLVHKKPWKNLKRKLSVPNYHFILLNHIRITLKMFQCFLSGNILKNGYMKEKMQGTAIILYTFTMLITRKEAK